MRIVIIGVGEVGFHVAKALSQEDFDITVIDNDPEKCRRASEHLDVIVVHGRQGHTPPVIVQIINKITAGYFWYQPFQTIF